MLSHLASLITFLCVDVPSAEENLQLMCLRYSLGIDQHSEYFQGYLYMITHHIVDKYSDVHEPCRWRGITCENGVIKGIQWYKGHTAHAIELEIIRLKWIPASVSSLRVAYQVEAKKDHLETRCFPRNARDISILCCEVVGSIDLTVLPIHIQSLVYRGNFLFGVADLRHLPSSLEHLDLLYTQIDKVIVNNLLLHDKLQQAHISLPEGYRLWPNTIEVVEMNGEDIDKRISVYLNTQ